MQQVNLSVLKQLNSEAVTVNICLVKLDEAELKYESELDEMWSFVGNKAKQRWLWHAIDHATGKVLAYVFGTSFRRSLSTTKSTTISLRY